MVAPVTHRRVRHFVWCCACGKRKEHAFGWAYCSKECERIGRPEREAQIERVNEFLRSCVERQPEVARG